MALAIVPRDAALAAAYPPSDLQVGPPPHLDVEADELHALAAELAADDRLSSVEALSQALALHDDLMSFAALWNIDAARAGNPDGHAPLPTAQAVHVK